MNINPFANVSLQDYLEIVQIVDSTFQLDHLITHLGWKIICVKTL